MSERVLKNTCPKCGTTLILKRANYYGCTICQHTFQTPTHKTVYVKTIGLGIREADRRKAVARMKYELSQHPEYTQSNMRMVTGYGQVMVRNFYRNVKQIFIYTGGE